jgi:hypothetical protein
MVELFAEILPEDVIPLLIVSCPEFETLRRVVVALAVLELIAKSVVFVPPLFAWMERFA